MQSFDDKVLATIGRVHRAEEAESAFRLARLAGFANIGLDLIYGLPQQTLTNWQATLERAIALNPDHLSAYGLKLEDGTPLAAAVADGSLPLPSEEDEEAMYDVLNEFLPLHGFERYEIANYAKPGQ